MTNLSICREFTSEQCNLLDQSMIKINHCLSQLDDEQIWWRPKQSTGLNSIGNLLLHLAGNLKQWGVVPLTQQADRRKRENEFVPDQDLPGQRLRQELQNVVDSAKSLFMKLDEQQLMQEHVIQGFPVTTLAAITHTCSHFVGHTHQVIQLTRLQLGEQYEFQWQPDAAKNDVPI